MLTTNGWKKKTGVLLGLASLVSNCQVFGKTKSRIVGQDHIDHLWGVGITFLAWPMVQEYRNGLTVANDS